jgi:hypothetical protein
VSIMIYYANNHCLIIDRLFAGVRGNLTQLTVSGVGVQTKVPRTNIGAGRSCPKKGSDGDRYSTT